jgi:hypothetical protein
MEVIRDAGGRVTRRKKRRVSLYKFVLYTIGPMSYCLDISSARQERRYSHI